MFNAEVPVPDTITKTTQMLQVEDITPGVGTLSSKKGNGCVGNVLQQVVNKRPQYMQVAGSCTVNDCNEKSKNTYCNIQNSQLTKSMKAGCDITKDSSMCYQSKSTYCQNMEQRQTTNAICQVIYSKEYL